MCCVPRMCNVWVVVHVVCPYVWFRCCGVFWDTHSGRQRGNVSLMIFTLRYFVYYILGFRCSTFMSMLVNCFSSSMVAPFHCYLWAPPYCNPSRCAYHNPASHGIATSGISICSSAVRAPQADVTSGHSHHGCTPTYPAYRATITVKFISGQP